MKAPVRFAVVGCGHIGKRHVAMIQGDDRAALVAVVDHAWAAEDEVSARPWRQRHEPLPRFQRP